MAQRVTIKEIAEELGLSTATVSNVIHGKTKKISEKTIKKVQEKLEESGYIPNMAAVLLAQNSSKIVCVVLSDDPKYEGKMLEDPFVSKMIGGISKELDRIGYFMMLKEEKDIKQIVRYASMWNMAGLILIGYCAMDYEKLRGQMHIPFAVVDAYTSEVLQYSDVGVDNIRGGRLAGEYLIEMGHRKIMYVSDNDEDCDHDRYIGLCQAFEESCAEDKVKAGSYHINFYKISEKKQGRDNNYACLKNHLSEYTAAFCASDAYAIELMSYLQKEGLSIPEDFSIIGFDDIPLASYVTPGLTTISQNVEGRARKAVDLLREMMEENSPGKTVLFPVELVERGSVKRLENREKQDQ